MKEILKQQFQASYKREAFEKNVLRPIFQGKVNEYVILDNQTAFPITLTDRERTIAKSITKYGHIVTSDDRKIELYEVVLKDDKVVERNKVSIGALVKKQIIGNNAIFVNFTYENPEGKNWRFSFIAFDSVFEAGDIKTIETNPKRYTYIFGEPDETYKTAVDCFSKLANELEIKIAKIKDAFGVEAMSKAFFDEYRDTHYKNFVNHLIHSNFKKSAFDGDEKAIRDFVKKLLGRIVFLYFLQKKGWLGASTLEYNDGDKNFISNFFKEAKQGTDFYPVWLSKLFFDTLNEKREEDNFTMPDGSVVKIPYLNGGLFEKDSDKTDFITFEPDLFAILFDFFDQYNFTVYEDSPDDHTVAVDPEMLGHIFENLLEDNPKTGTFYTPKQIVQYMTQESLIEYLGIHLPNKKAEISKFIKDRIIELNDIELKKIDFLIDKVKICDPAIGSGAFPMGLLQEIFSLKEQIAYRFGFKVWKPALVKENIIQNSIYGVDIEKGAVDIARLRFWLSLIVDEDLPKALPNLDYKIIIGNTLVSKFENQIINIDWKITKEIHDNLFGSPLQEEKEKLLNEISNKQKLFFHAEGEEKKMLSSHVRKLKAKVLIKQLEQMIEINGFREDRGKVLNKKQLDFKLETQSWRDAILDLKRIENNPELPFNHFDWRLDFPEILNPIVSENEVGFDIVIGNPPYIKEYTNKDAFDGFRKSDYYQGKMDLWYGFSCMMIDNLKDNGIQTFIAQNNWTTSAGASKLRFKILTDTEIKSFVDFGNYKVFQSAGIQTMIYVVQKKKYEAPYSLKYSVLIDDKIPQSKLNDFLNFDLQNEFAQKYIFEVSDDMISDKSFTFNTNDDELVLSQILNHSNFKLSEKEVANGIHPHYDFVNKKISEASLGELKNGEGIFGLSDEELKNLNLLTDEKQLIKPYYTTENFKGYYTNPKNKLWLIYTDSSFKNPENIKPYPNIKKHLDRFKNIITSDNKPYGLHRAREERFFLGEKIIVQRKCPDRPVFTYTDFDSYVSATFYVIKPFSLNQKYLTALLNSRLIAFWLRNKGSMQGNNFQLDKAPLLNIPLFVPNDVTKFTILVDYLLYLNNPNNEQILSHTDNKRIANHIEEILNSMVNELYFEKHMKDNELDVLEYLNPKSIESLNESEQLEIIKNFYLWYQEPQNPVRQAIMLVDTKSKDILVKINKNSY